MKSPKRLTKGILISLVLVLLLNMSASFIPTLKNNFGTQVAYAQDGGEGEAEGEGESESAKEPAPPASEVRFEDIVKPLEPVDKATVKRATEYKDIIDTAANLATRVHRIFAPAINFFAFQIGNFLGTDYVYEGSMGKMLQKIWVITRNLVNIVFVFLLLIMALQTIFNPGFGMDELKKKLLLFVAIVVAVNFSWLGTKVVLDASNVATQAIFAIPSGLVGNDSVAYEQCVVSSNPEEPTRGACTPSAIFAPADAADKPVLYFEDNEKRKDGDSNHCERVKEAYAEAYDSEGKAKKLDDDNDSKKFQKRTSICMENLNLFSYDQNTAVVYLTYGMARIQNLVQAHKTNDPIQLSVGVLMSLIIQTAYTVSLMALFIALIIRMLALWIFVAFSPVLVLMLYFKGDGNNPLQEVEDKFSITQFVNWAFVPAKVGAIFVVAFIMISAGQSLGKYTGTLVNNLETKSGVPNYIYEPQSLFGGMDSLQNLLWLIMTVVILWMGVFAILNKMPIINKITEKIDSAGRNVASTVVSFPYKAPILPLGQGGAKQSLQKTFGQLDFTKKLREYYGEGDLDKDATTVNKNAGSSGARSAVSSAISRGADKLDPGEAKKLASAFGVELDRFAKLDSRTKIAALQRAGAGENASKLVNEMDRHAEALKRSASPATNRAAIKEDEAVRQQVRGNAPAPGAPASGAPASGNTPGGPTAPTPPAPTPPAVTPKDND